MGVKARALVYAPKMPRFEVEVRAPEEEIKVKERVQVQAGPREIATARQAVVAN
jgi:hypothetical protein